MANTQLDRLDIDTAVNTSQSGQETRVWRILRRVGTCIGLGRCFRPPRVIKTSASPKRGSPARSQRGRQGNGTKTLRKDPLPFLSSAYGHQTHNGCFVMHLIDAVRVHTSKQRLEAQLMECEKQASAARVTQQSAVIRLERLQKEPAVIPSMQYLEAEQQETIKSSATTTDECAQRAETLKQQLNMVGTIMRLCMGAIFETYDAYLGEEDGDELLLTWNFGELLQTCRRCWQDLEKEQIALKALMAARKVGIDPLQMSSNDSVLGRVNVGSTTASLVQGTPDAAPTLDVPSLKFAEIIKRIREIRQCYIELQDDLLGQQAKTLLGDRARLIRPLTAQLLSKTNLHSTTSPISTTPISPSRRSQRSPSGRPHRTHSPSPPPMSPRLKSLTQNLLTAKSALSQNITSRTELTDYYLRTFLSYLVAFPGYSQQGFHDLYVTPSGRNFTEEQADLLMEQNRLEEDEDRAREEVRMYLDQRGKDDCLYLSGTESMDPRTSDYVGSRAVKSWKGSEVDDADAKKIRKWHKGIAEDFDGEQEMVERPDSEMEIEEGSEYEWAATFNDDRSERRARRLRRYEGAMRAARLDAIKVKNGMLGLRPKSAGLRSGRAQDTKRRESA